MSPFRFRLARLLKLREDKERERAIELGRALRAEDERRRAVAEAEAQLDKVGGQLAREAAPQPAGTFHLLCAAVAHAADRILNAEASHREAASQVEAEQERYRDARIERRAMERLRERREDAWRVDQVRAEQKEGDEIARQRRARNESPQQGGDLR